MKKSSVEACVDWLMYILRPGPTDDIVNEMGAMVPGLRGTQSLPYMKGYTTDMDRLTTDPNFKDVHVFATRWQVSAQYASEMGKTVTQLGLKEINSQQAVEHMDQTLNTVAPDLIKTNGWDTSKWGTKTAYPADGQV
jgi:hypothetical protein